MSERPAIEIGSRSGWLSPTTMPVAPAASALAILAVNGQVPRSTYTNLPLTAAALSSAEQPSVVDGPASLAASVPTTTSVVTPVLSKTGPNAAAAAPAHGPAISAGLLMV